LYLCVASDGQDLVSDLDDSKSMTPADDENFKAKLKASVVLAKVEVANDSTPSKTEKIIEQMQEFDKAIQSKIREEVYMKTLTGRNIRLLYKRKMRTKGNKRKKGEKEETFIDFVKKHIPYSKSQIYFLMDLYELCEVYPRLSYVTIGIGVLKTKFKLVKKLVKDESIYWKNTDH
jgi:hypothetical protein